jgi:hypothetical protein
MESLFAFTFGPGKADCGVLVQRFEKVYVRVSCDLLQVSTITMMMTPPSTQSEELQLRWISRDYSLYLGTLGGGKDMMETRVERTE